MKDSLFGKYCYIDTPWIAGKKTVYRILASSALSNTYCNVPVNAKTKPEWHRDFEPIVFVVLDTLVGESSKIWRFALKDVEIIDDESKEVKHGEWVKKAEAFTNLYGETEYVVHGICSVCNQRQSFGNYPFCPWCGADMRGEAE